MVGEELPEGTYDFILDDSSVPLDIFRIDIIFDIFLHLSIYSNQFKQLKRPMSAPMQSWVFPYF